MKKLKLSLSAAALLAISLIQAQNYYTRIPGQWNDSNSVWSTISRMGPPCSCYPGNVVSSGSVFIYNSITSMVALSTVNGTAHITVQSGNSLTLTPVPYLALGGNAVITINAGGTLILAGNLNMNNSASIVNNGILTILGNATLSNNATIIVNGTMTINGNVTTSNSASFSGTGTVSVGGAITGPGTSMLIHAMAPAYSTNTTYGGLVQDGTPNNALFGADVATGNPGFGNSGFGTLALGPMGSAISGSLNTAVGYQALTSDNGAADNVAVGYDAMLNCLTCAANTASGQDALAGNVAGIANSAFGDNALEINNSSYNIGIGNVSLGNNGLGTQNTAVGWHALLSAPGSNASFNTGIGDEVLYFNGTGQYNSVLGMQAMYNNSNGDYNTASGYQAMYGFPTRITGTGNTAAGSQSLFNLTGGIYNTADGYQAMYGAPGVMLGEYNVGAGYQTLYNLTLGRYNTASGYQAMHGAAAIGIAGYYNVASGYETMYNIGDGYYNIASGYQAMHGNGVTLIAGNDNIATGFQALENIWTGSYNIAIGYQAMQGLPAPLITGDENTAVGYQSINNITSGTFNTAEGYQSSFSNTSAWYNVAIGYQALMDNVTTYSLTAVGSGALQDNTTGSLNTALGFSALQDNVSGKSNSASGYQALHQNLAGSSNTAMGYRALFFNLSDWNTAYGDSALYSNSTGKDNTSTGGKSMSNTTIGKSNTANGYDALFNNIMGCSNTAMGYQALFFNASDWNTALGDSALYTNVGGKNNTSTGGKSMRNNVSGISNTANGFEAMLGNTIGSSNTAVGYQALNTNIADWNTAVGDSALWFNLFGKNNTSTGGKSLVNNFQGSSNTASGYEALFKNTASFNSAFGDSALYNNTTGTYNTAVGYDALLNNVTGSYNSALGYSSGIPVATTYTNTIALGYDAVVNASNTMELGNNSVNVAIGMSNPTVTAAPTNKLEISYYSNLNPKPLVAAPSYPFTGACPSTGATGASGLQFRDLTSVSTPYPANPGTGVLALDCQGNVIYVPQSIGTGFGYCTPGPIPALTGDAGLNLNKFNLYFAGNGAGGTVNNVVIGNGCGYVPKAKLDVLQASGSDSTIAEYVENTDPTTGTVVNPHPLISIEGYTPYVTSAFYNVAGWFSAPGQTPQYAIFVPQGCGSTSFAPQCPQTQPQGGVVSIGYPFYTTIPNFNYLLQVSSNILSNGMTTYSDSVLKKNVANFYHGLDVIRRVQPVSFLFKGILTNDTIIPHYGYIAEDLQRVAPYATVPLNGSEYLGIDQMAVLYTAINAIRQVDSIGTSNQHKDSIVLAAQQLSIDSLRHKIDSVVSSKDSIARVIADSTGTLYTTNGSSTTQLQAVGANSFYNTSDQRCKTSITNIPNALELVDKLNGIYFKWNQAAYPWKHFPSGQQVGFIAQQVDTVVPQVVTQNDSGYYTLDYGRITPLLVDAIKQQKQTNDSLRYSLDSLRHAFLSIQSCLSRLCDEHHRHSVENGSDSNTTSNVQDVILSSENTALLYQNIPNPFSTGTKINYFLPPGTMGASIVFYDSYGNQIKQVQLSQTGNGTLNITPDNLTNGIYSYSLVVNGNVLDTKRMVLQK